VPGVKEKYHNFKVLFDLLDLDNQPQCKLLLLVDLKAANLSLGMQAARAR
jgi:hypothetical protein